MTITDTQRAYQIIKDRIIKTQMLPGAIVHEADLIAELGLGRTPIREALKMLEADRLVTISPRRAIFITSIGLSDLAEIEEIRSVLDPLCVRLAAKRIEPAELAKLRNLVNQGLAALKDDLCEPAALLELDRSFHLALAGSTHNRLLRGEIEMFYNLSMRIWYYYLSRVEPGDLAFDALQGVVDGLHAGDAERAEEAMHAHIRNFGSAIKRLL